MASITIKNIPEELYEKLRTTATLNHRSINSEMINYLESVLMPKRLTISEKLQRAKSIRSKINSDAFSPYEISRAISEGDERILENGDFVESVLKAANEHMERKYDLRARGFCLTDIAARVAEVLGVEQEKVWAAGRHQKIVQARSILCYWAVRELGVTMISLSRRLNLMVSNESEGVEIISQAL